MAVGNVSPALNPSASFLTSLLGPEKMRLESREAGCAAVHSGKATGLGMEVSAPSLKRYSLVCGCSLMSVTLIFPMGT